MSFPVAKIGHEHALPAVTPVVFDHRHGTDRRRSRSTPRSMGKFEGNESMAALPLDVEISPGDRNMEMLDLTSHLDRVCF